MINKKQAEWLKMKLKETHESEFFIIEQIGRVALEDFGTAMHDDTVRLVTEPQFGALAND